MGSSAFGRVTIRDANVPPPWELAKYIGVAAARHQYYIWEPPNALAAELPGTIMPLSCEVGADGVRRFFPLRMSRRRDKEQEAFLGLATNAGIAILNRVKQMTPEHRNSYRSMRLLFQYVHRMRECFGHRFDIFSDLVIRSARRDATEDPDILPPDVGVTSSGKGRRWSVGELCARGAEAAKAASYPFALSTTECIHYGLIAAAKLNPWQLRDKKVPDLVQSVLFNVDPADVPSEEIRGIVEERFQTAVWPHLTDPQDKFDKWLRGRNSTLVSQLAKQKKAAGGPLPVEDVRRTLVHFGWRSYDYAAGCIHVVMRYFQKSLPEPLTEKETLYFEHMFFPQAYLGGLPFVLLARRYPCLDPLLWEMWDRLPDQSLRPVLYRLLGYYAYMARRRREVDKSRKRPKPSMLVVEPPGREKQTARMADIAAGIRKRQNLKCRCRKPAIPKWIAKLARRTKKNLRIHHCCEQCEFEAETLIPLTEFTQLAKSMFPAE